MTALLSVCLVAFIAAVVALFCHSRESGNPTSGARPMATLADAEAKEICTVRKSANGKDAREVLVMFDACWQG